MIKIRDSLITQGIDINDNIFNNTIISSIPNEFRPTIYALVIISAKNKDKLKPAELISTICAEAMGYSMRNEQKKESAHYAGNSQGKGGFRGQGKPQRGNFRGRGMGKSSGNSRATSNCYNCGRKGHFGNECPSEKAAQANQAKE